MLRRATEFVLRRQERQRLTVEPVPFEMRPSIAASAIVFRESPRAEARAWIAMGGLFGFGSLMGIFLFAVDSGSRSLVLLAYCAGALALSTAFFWLAWVMRNGARSLFLDLAGKRAGLYRGSSDVRRRIVVAADCRMTRCRVKLIALRTRSGRPVLYWHGFSLIVQVDEHRFPIAVCGTEAEIDAYIQTLPHPLRSGWERIELLESGANLKVEFATQMRP